MHTGVQMKYVSKADGHPARVFKGNKSCAKNRKEVYSIL